MQNLVNERIKQESHWSHTGSRDCVQQRHTPANAVIFCSLCISEESEKRRDESVILTRPVIAPFSVAIFGS